MKNWVTLQFVYNFNPSLDNYITYRFYHFKFCSKDNPAIPASLYIDNLYGEVENELEQQKSVNKKSLTLAFIKRILESGAAKQQMILLFEKKQTVVNNDEIKQFLENVNLLLTLSAQPQHMIPSAPITLPEESNQPGQLVNEERPVALADFPVRTYIIATHMYLEITNNELHYETLIRDTTRLKEFITAKFKANKIAGRIADMKSFSYKKVLSGKNNGNAIGQLKPQIEQIAVNPSTFGEDVSAFARNVLKNIAVC